MQSLKIDKRKMTAEANCKVYFIIGLIWVEVNKLIINCLKNRRFTTQLRDEYVILFIVNSC